MKKILLGLGTLAFTVVPTVSIISCGSSEKSTLDKLKDSTNSAIDKLHKSYTLGWSNDTSLQVVLPETKDDRSGFWIGPLRQQTDGTINTVSGVATSISDTQWMNGTGMTEVDVQKIYTDVSAEILKDMEGVSSIELFKDATETITVQSIIDEIAKLKDLASYQAMVVSLNAMLTKTSISVDGATPAGHAIIEVVEDNGQFKIHSTSTTLSKDNMAIYDELLNRSLPVYLKTLKTIAALNVT